MDRALYRNRVAIVGYGVAKSLRHADRPIGAVAVETADAAIRDAGLRRQQIDGVATASSLPSYATGRVLRPGYEFVDTDYLIEHMGLDTTWSYDDREFPPALVRAVQAIASGAAKYVLLNRTLHNPKGRYHSFRGVEASGEHQWTAPYGFIASTYGIAMPYMEYQKRYGVTRDHTAALAVQIRKNVQSIPEAYWHGTELTVEDYLASRMISEPMCLYDNDIPVDGGGSFVVTTAERAADLPYPPVYITDWSVLHTTRWPTPGSWGSLHTMYEPTIRMLEKMWNRSGWKAADIDVPQPYDGFLPLILFWLECLGFCDVGEARHLVEDRNIAPTGRFPLLSGGGNLGWGRLHGLPHILENYLQLSVRAGPRQIAGATTGLSTYSIPGLPGATAILYSSDPSV